MSLHNMRFSVLGFRSDIRIELQAPVVKPKVKRKTHSILGGFQLLPPATLVIHQRFTHASFLIDLYLECRYEDLRYIRSKMNMVEENQIRISSTFFLTCKIRNKI